VPGARIEVMPGVGHWLPRLRPEAVAAAVRANGST
jgi:pimeloyl-ACP methyl ester carboxylesterase